MFRRFAFALPILLLGMAAATAADAAATFAFSFTAPWQNLYFGDDGLTFVATGDTARGSGVFTTEDADADGAYAISAVLGSWTFYDGGEERAINAFDGGFGGDVGLVTPIAGGGYTISNIGLYDSDNPGGIVFATQDAVGSQYTAFGGEVIATAATFTVTPQAASDVPEPASWAMMVAGFGLIGGTIRRRKVVFA